MEFYLALTALAWLVPNHYSPWSSAWNESLAILGIILALASVSIQGQELRISRSLIALVLVCWIVIFFQVITGKIIFGGDGIMAALYVGIWFASVIVGGFLFSGHRQSGIHALALIWAVFALASVAVAVIQWTDVFSLGIYGVEMPPGSRPFANVAQPNHLCTLTFMGLCGVILLHQSRHVGIFSFWLVALVLLGGMVLSESRTGWLQIAWLGFVLLFFHRRIGLRLRRIDIITILVVFYGLTGAFGSISEWMLLSSSRSLSEQMDPGLRLPYWSSMLDAIIKEPLFGYGWQQVGIAQQNIAIDHPAFGVLFEHSHNIILDLLLWNGLVLGGAILTLLAVWVWSVRQSSLNARVFWLALVFGGLVIHAMLEFPLEYAYFLVPLGLAMGALDTANESEKQKQSMPKKAVWVLGVTLAVIFSFVVKDYLSAEMNYRHLRLESARIGTERLITPAPDLHLLSQLEALLVFARSDAKPNMEFQDLVSMRSVSLRYGYPPVMFRYALAAGLNNQPEEAKITLDKICKIHGSVRCNEAVKGWKLMQVNYPILNGIDF